MTNRNMEIANEIFRQLGGNRFMAMTGAKNFMAIDNGLQFQLPARFAKNGINVVRITLNDLDLYDVEYGMNTRKKDKDLGIMVPDYKVIKTEENIYNDMLQERFTDVTGLQTRLF